MDGVAPTRVLTEVRAVVDEGRGDELVAGFEAMLAGPRPDGLLRTELVHGDGQWRIQTLWRDREALASMRSAAEEPAAPRLFRSVGAEPQVSILEVRAGTEW
jgi:heme-degrading monooxygenase HmoA